MNKDHSRLAGYLLFGMICCSILVIIRPEFPLILPGLCAWTALYLLKGKLSRPQLIQSLVLSTIGIVCLSWGWNRGVAPDLGVLLSKNHLLLSLLAAGSFLSLISLPVAGKSEQLPIGKAAFTRTLLGAHIFSSVINLSIIMIVAERLNFREKHDQTLAILLTRSFGAAAFWSPFFAAMATALTYSPGASLTNVILMGLPLSLAGLVITQILLKRNQLENFVGYPIHFSSLWVPGLLVFSVFTVHYNFPEISILAVITFFAILITVLALLISKPGQAITIIDRHIASSLPTMVNELALFLSAGILAAGLSNLLLSYNDIPMLNSFGVLQAITLLTIMVMIALIGVHPVISVAIVGTWLAPSQFNPDLLALIFVFAWGLGVAVSPLSGLNLTLQGRFGISGLKIMKWNASYTLKMLFVASLLFWIYSP